MTPPRCHRFRAFLSNTEYHGSAQSSVTVDGCAKYLKSMIGEQKLILNDLLLVLNNYKNEEVIQGYITDLESIKQVYDEVKITYEVGEPQTIEKDGMLMVIQSETSHVMMSAEILEKIIDTTLKIRNQQLNI